MVATCEAQGKAHMIWETSLTMYVVASAVMFTVLYLVALSFPLTEAVVLGVFSYWGYHELYSTEPYCVGFVQYEEIPLWAFGDFTWKAQAGMAAACLPLGLLALLSPLWLEVVDVECRV